MKDPLPIKIVGIGRYLPERVVTNSEVEEILGLPQGHIDTTHAGVKERRWITDETNSFMGARALEGALEDAGFEAKQLDLIINASGSQEQAIPDGAPLIQRELGLGQSGITCLSVHTTCLSFLAALNIAANFLANGQYERIGIVSADIASRAINPKDPESFMLFGDAAAAVVVTRTPEGEPSAMSDYVFRTFGEGAYLTAVMGGGIRRHPNYPGARPEDNLFRMDGKAVYLMAVQHSLRTIGMLRLSLARGLGDIKCVIPHQASGLALKGFRKVGWEDEKIVKTLHKLGNCIAASIPATLYEAIKVEKRLNRGDEFLLFGTGAGLSIGAAICTW